MNTPRASNSSLSEDSPDRLFRRLEAQEVLEDDAATHTEATEKEGERLRGMSAKLRALESTDRKQVHFVIRVDQLVNQCRELQFTGTT